MSLAGWLTMIISIGGVLTLVTWCFIRVFSSSAKKEESVIELITPDMETYQAEDDE